MRELIERFKQMCRENLSEAKTLSGSHVTAYHCGRDIGSGSFSLKFLGKGEGYRRPPLGPGIYFATDENIGRLYCKYVRNPVFYTVRIPTSGLYNHVWGTPEKLRDSMNELFARESESRGWKDKHGHKVHQLAEMMGPMQAAKALADAGIKGIWTDLPAGGEEIAVFDPRIIKIVERS